MAANDGSSFRRWRGKLPHIHAPEYPYLITSHIEDDITCLADVERTEVLKACLYWNGKGWDFIAAVVMPTHFHIVVSIARDQRENTNISILMKSIKSFTARKLNQARERTGQLWAREYHDVTLQNDGTLNAAVEYVMHNPVKAKLSKKPEDYPWLWTKWGGAKAIEDTLE